MKTLSLDQLEQIQGGAHWPTVALAAQAGATAGGTAGALYAMALMPGGPPALPFALGAVAIGAWGGGIAGGVGEYLRQNRR